MKIHPILFYFILFYFTVGTKNEVWKYHLNGQWFEDGTVKVECSGDGPTTTPHPTGQSISEPIFSQKDNSKRPIGLKTFTL